MLGHSRKRAFQDAPVLNSNLSLVSAVDRVEVWRTVVPPVHVDHDAVELRQPGHDSCLHRACDGQRHRALIARSPASDRPRTRSRGNNSVRNRRTHWAWPQPVGREPRTELTPLPDCPCTVRHREVAAVMAKDRLRELRRAARVIAVDLPDVIPWYVHRTDDGAR